MISIHARAILLIGALILLSCSSNKPDNANSDYIAKIGTGFEIYFDELHDYTRTRFFDRRYPDQVEAHLAALSQLTDNQLKRMDFFDRKLDQNDDVLRPILRIINEELVIEYFKRVFQDKYLTDERVVEAHRQLDREVIFRQIVLFKDPDASDEHINNLRNRAADILQQVRSGGNFAALADQYSEHNSAQAGGIMPAVDWFNSTFGPINAFVFRQDQSVTEVLETESSIHIVQITQINSKSIPPLEQIRQEILTELTNRYIETSQEEYDTYRESLIDSNSLDWNEVAMRQILTWASHPAFFQGNYRDILNGELSAGRNLILLRYNSGREATLADYRRLLDEVLAMAVRPSYTIDDIKGHIMEALKTEYLVNEANKLDLRKNILHRYTKNSVFRNQLVILYNQHVIEPQLPDPVPERLKEFYTMIRDTAFYRPATVETRLIRVKGAVQANEMKTLYQNGTPFDDLAHEKLLRNFYTDMDGNLFTRHRVHQPMLAKEAFSMEVGQIAGPFTFDNGDGTQSEVLMVVDSISEAHLPSFDEVTQSVLVQKYRDYHFEQINRSILANLRNKHPILVNEPLLKQKLQEIGRI